MTHNHEFIPGCAQEKDIDRTKIKTVNAIVVFGDISGFTNWTRRSVNQAESIKKLLDNFSLLISRLVKNSGYWAKMMGDGVMLVKEVNHVSPDKVADILLEVQAFCLKVRFLISTLTYPRPQGFRCRVVAGPVIKWFSENDKCQGAFVEYVGYTCNLCSRLLYVYRDESCVAHESIKELMKDSERIEFLHLPKPEHIPSGIDIEDALELYSFREAEK